MAVIQEFRNDFDDTVAQFRPLVLLVDDPMSLIYSRSANNWSRVGLSNNVSGSAACDEQSMSADKHCQ